jgi:hypothetical protein
MTDVLATTRWIVAGLLLAFSVLVSVMNGAMVIRYFLRKKRSSLAPFVGGLSGAVGMLVVPLHVARWCWVPFLLDVSCPLTVATLLRLAWNRRIP